MKVSVAMKEGTAVSEHLGYAKRFAIYKVTPESVRLLVCVRRLAGEAP